MPPFIDHILVGVVLGGALLYVCRTWRGKRKGGCDACAPAKKPPVPHFSQKR